jgi:hypothetical protein
MSLCPICHKALCDHTLEERGQTYEQMMAPLTPKEMAEWDATRRSETLALSPGVRRLFDEEG